MKRILPFLTMLCLLFTAAGASSSLGAVFEGANADLPSAALPITAQQWIRDFLGAADARGLTLEEGFSYEPGMVTGQHSYDLEIAETPLYNIGLAVFSEDGVAISLCSLRMNLDIAIPSNELVQASDILRRTMEAMIAASTPDASQEEIEALCEALCPDLAAALIRKELVEASQVGNGIRCSLWAGPVSNEDPLVYDGLIVDFVIEPAGAESVMQTDDPEPPWPMPQATLDWYAAFESAAEETELALPGGFIYHEEPAQPVGLDVYGELRISDALVVRVMLGEDLLPYRAEVILEAEGKEWEELRSDYGGFEYAMRAVMRAFDPSMDDEEAGDQEILLVLRVTGVAAEGGVQPVSRASLRGVAYELIGDPGSGRAVFSATPMADPAH